MDRGVTRSSSPPQQQQQQQQQQLQLDDLLTLDRDMHPHACGELLWRHWVQAGAGGHGMFT